MFCQSTLHDNDEYLNRFALKLTKNQDDAKDLLQNTYLKALEKKHLYKEDSNLKSWLGAIMYNTFVTAYRRKTKFETQYDPESVIEHTGVSGHQEGKTEVLMVTNAMEKLSPDHKEILVLVCVQQYSYAAVAKHLDVPVGTVRSRLSRARESLQDILDNPTPPANQGDISFAHIIEKGKVSHAV